MEITLNIGNEQIPVVIKFGRMMQGNFYSYLVVFPDGKEKYMPLERLEALSGTKVNPRSIKTLEKSNSNLF